MAKRLFDLLLAVCGLVLFAPLFLAIAVWIKLDSPGPVFFRQERVGRWGVPFRIHKFRTMHHEPGVIGPQITVGADPRITRAGSMLRRSKLDELPQLLDVLAGAMSIVGPRPEVPRYVAHYPEETRARVLSVRPGITDPASLAFRRENELLAQSSDPEREYVEVILPAKLRVALAYIDQASLRTDLNVILRTARLIFD